MGGKIDNYRFGQGGVNRAKNPLQLGDDESTQLQNAELFSDDAKAGDGALCKRGGLQALTSALAGSVLGMISLPLQTTYARTLYISLGDAAANTWKKTTDGTTFTDSSLFLGAADDDNIWSVLNYEIGARIAAFGNKLYYPGRDHVSSATPANNTAPELDFLDGTNSFELLRLDIGPEGDGNYPWGITDMIVAENVIYFGIWDPPDSAAPNLRGRVMKFDPQTGLMSQVCEAFGNNSGDITGGYPSCLAWHQGQLFVGLNGHTGLGAVAGKVVRCRPSTDSAWTSDVVALLGFPTTMETFKGDLYVGMRGFAGTTAPRVYKRTAATGVYTSVENGADNGITYYSSLCVYNDELYVALFEGGGGTPVAHIRKTADGASWSTDYDVDANVAGWTNTRTPVNMIVFNGILFSSWKCAGSGTDGFVLKRSGGTWSTAFTGNVIGHMGILTERT